MPHFEIHGYGRDTGRKRKRTYVADSEEDAMQKASADGTITETVTRVPDPPQEPATEAQKSYARSLGIDFAPEIGKWDISELIQDALDDDVDVVKVIRKLAAKHRTVQITYWKYGEAEATTRIVEPYETVAMADQSGHTRDYIRCWQLWPPPEDGDHWRTFRPDRIKSAKDGGTAFSPRIPVTVHTGRARPYKFGDDARSRPGCFVTLIFLSSAIFIAWTAANILRQ